jgi:lysophospholipase L1-like esterase
MPARSLLRRGAAAVATLAGVTLTGASVAGAAPAVPIRASTAAHVTAASCTGMRWVASWAASPTDAVTPVDPAGGAVPVVANHQTLRMVIAPHLGGSTLRVRLSNRFGASSVTFGRVTVGRQTRGAAVAGAVPVRFGGAQSVTVAPGGDVLSDPVTLRFAPSEHLAVSIFVPGLLVPVTKHWNANATSYVAPAFSGDRAAETGATAFTDTTQSWLYLAGVDALAPASTRSVVAFGDSITDGFVGGSSLSVPVDTSVADTDGRYPDFLQRRLDDAGVPVSVVNAGIGSNMLLTSGEPLMLGPAGLERFRADALAQSGVTGVLVLEGINDLGLARSGAAELVAGFENLVEQAHAAGVEIWLGTVLPASNALIHGIATAPDSERDRQQVNSWIRRQTLADGVVDFDRALRDPSDPAVLHPAYASVDNLHPSPAGYRKMAETVDLAMLTSGACALRRG